MNNPSFIRTALMAALPLAVLTTVILGVEYMQQQQIFRQIANEPQVQLAESIATQLSMGVPPQAFTQGGAAPLETIQTPYVLVYDAEGNFVTGNASVGGQPPQLPKGVFGSHKDNFGTSDNRITWQPTADIRQALVITPFSTASTTGYVVVGRSLRETENQEGALTGRTIFGWIIAMIAVAVVAFITAWFLRGRQK